MTIAQDQAAERYRLLRLEFIKAALIGITSNEDLQGIQYEDLAMHAVRLADATLAAAGEKGA